MPCPPGGDAPETTLSLKGGEDIGGGASISCTLDAVSGTISVRGGATTEVSTLAATSATNTSSRTGASSVAFISDTAPSFNLRTFDVFVFYDAPGFEQQFGSRRFVWSYDIKIAGVAGFRSTEREAGGEEKRA